jgi:hypothetical protein
MVNLTDRERLFAAPLGLLSLKDSGVHFLFAEDAPAIVAAVDESRNAAPITTTVAPARAATA